jgi:hypothetical protein
MPCPIFEKARIHECRFMIRFSTTKGAFRNRRRGPRETTTAERSSKYRRAHHVGFCLEMRLLSVLSTGLTLTTRRFFSNKEIAVIPDSQPHFKKKSSPHFTFSPPLSSAAVEHICEKIRQRHLFVLNISFACVIRVGVLETGLLLLVYCT